MPDLYPPSLNPSDSDPPDPPLVRLLAVLIASRRAGCSFALHYDEPTGEWAYTLDETVDLAYVVGRGRDFGRATDAVLARLGEIERDRERRERWEADDEERIL